MPGPVWKRLPAGDMAAFRSWLDALPQAERPVYGLIGVEASWWSCLGGGARPFVVLFHGGWVTLSKRSFRRHRQVERRDYPAGDLRRVSVRRGPLLESARLWFADGWSVRVGSLPRRQSQPAERFLAEGAAALEPARLTPEQVTNTCLACRAMGLLPGGFG